MHAGATDTTRNELLAELAGRVRGQCLWAEPLARHTTYGVGGAAELVVVPADAGDLTAALDFCSAHSLRWRVMGNGSNLLVHDGPVAGVVFKVRGCLDYFHLEGTRLTAGAGAMLARAAEAAAGADLSGLEWLAGIPGTLGGAVAMNAGAHGHSVGELVRRVTLWQEGAGVISLGADELAFGYRDSALRHSGLVALEVELELAPCGPGEAARRTRELLVRRKAAQPLGRRSAGSVFRNPEGGKAWALIDQAGLKGSRVGGAEVSPKHANFIVTRPGATAADILELMDLARRLVRERTGVELRPEVVVWED